MNDQIPEPVVLSEEEQITQLLENLPTEADVFVDVPSRGIPYFGKESKVQLRPMTFNDEKSLSTGARTPQFNAANYLLSKCVLNVSVPHLLIIDKLFLLLKIREISYGNDYRVKIQCSRCDFENTLTLLLDQLLCNYADADMEFGNKEVQLSGIGKSAVVSLLTVSDEQFMEKNNLYSNLWRFIRKLGDIDNEGIIQKVIEKLPIADVHTIVNAISLSEYGIQPQIRFNCDSCNTSNKVTLPIDENFFSVN